MERVVTVDDPLGQVEDDEEEETAEVTKEIGCTKMLVGG